MALASPAPTSNRVQRIFLRMCVFLRKGRANCLGAPPILACGVSGNDRLTEASRQGWAALPGSLPYPRASLFIVSGRRNATRRLLREKTPNVRGGFEFVSGLRRGGWEDNLPRCGKVRAGYAICHISYEMWHMAFDIWF